MKLNVAAFALLGISLVRGAVTWQHAVAGESCQNTCDMIGMDCDNETRIGLDTFAKVVDVMTSLGATCLACNNGCMNGNPSGPFTTDWMGSTFYCNHREWDPTSSVGGASCSQQGSGSSRNICACKDKPVCNLSTNEISTGTPPFECNFNIADSCQCQTQCELNGNHVSFAWNENSQPNCCCFTD